MLRNHLLTFLAAMLFTALLGGRVLAAEDTPRFNQIHFQVERSRTVDNDRMQATLTANGEDEDAARLADSINRTMAWAVQTAKKQPAIEVRTGGFRTDPVYERARIRRWRASQELVLVGGDFAVLSSVIGKLQERLQVTSMAFTVSPQRRAAIEDELIAEALEAFKQRSERVRKQLDAAGYKIVDIAINTGGQMPIPMAMGRIQGASAEMAATVEAGASTVSVTVNGGIELR